MTFDKTISFLKAIKKNNNREWFEKNKSKYLEAKEEFEVFVQQLIAGINKFDKKIDGNMLAKNCVFRIYKDVRFSKDKTPYKTHFGAYFSPGGKKSNAAGYYFHFEPGNMFLAGGNWQPEPPQLQSIRQEIDYNGTKLVKIIKSKSFQKYFEDLSEEDKLKTSPKGFDKDSKYLEYLKLKSFIVYHKISDKSFKTKTFEKFTIEGYKAMYPLIQFLREASDS